MAVAKGEMTDTNRQCAFTRRKWPKDVLLRLELDHQGAILVDLQNILKGRGVYLTPSEFRRALQPKALHRLFKGKAAPMSEDEIENLLRITSERLTSRVCELIGLGRRTGKLAFGFEAVGRAIQNLKYRPMTVLATNDIAPRSENKIQQLISNTDQVELVRALTKEVLGRTLGRETVSVVAVWHPKIGRRFLNEVTRLDRLHSADIIVSSGGRKG
ncbi:MAG: DUF448 domain-containing protein [Myxococcota bacterium]|nr:DUF448 domain-containing protein [Myxococcota bacterium]